MNVNTKLNMQDLTRAYKNLASFLFRHPVIGTILLILSGLVSELSMAQFPLKMAALVALLGFSVALVTTQYRTGSLGPLLAELKFQQPLWLGVITGVLALSWGGIWVAQHLVRISGAAHNQHSDTAIILDGTVLGGMVVGAALICMTQIMPLVLSYFCLSLGLNKKQGEAIWLKLLTQLKLLVAFMPVASLAVVAAFIGLDVSALFVVLSALYATFVLFIVFEIDPAPPREVVRFTLTPQTT
ncbi:hypothetical protein IT774_02070 [Salinimonas marina]|uniref:Uncharacterized protein n=1 Tax=Salinimonas marina TaxID=2785918 RepID=A0A7S9HDB9_9ALTE|nr:hypothetical protein [Salinimonas marina]QPG06050.1 hypothetical protein IT774_02070 [Salinimonas marina]